MENNQLNTLPGLGTFLLEYARNAIAENPPDLINHAADYFNRLRDERLSDQVLCEEGSKEFIAKALGPKSLQRRSTVMGEQYNPEEDDGEEDEDIEITPKTDEERQRIRQHTEEIFLFRVLDDADLNAVIDAMFPKNVKKGDVIIKQGDDGDFFYLVDSGNFDVVIKAEGKDKPIFTYKGRGFFGELALLHNQPRAATVTAATDGLLWAVGRKTFNKLIVKRAFEKRRMYMKLLGEVEQLKPLTEYEIMQVADALSGKSYSEGDVIVKEGDVGDGMYFIVEGNVSVTQIKDTDEGNKDVEIDQLGNGKFFGELALLKGQPRAATVIALEDTKVAFLESKAFERLLGPCMEILARHTENY